MSSGSVTPSATSEGGVAVLIGDGLFKYEVASFFLRLLKGRTEQYLYKVKDHVEKYCAKECTKQYFVEKLDEVYEWRDEVLRQETDALRSEFPQIKQLYENVVKRFMLEISHELKKPQSKQVMVASLERFVKCFYETIAKDPGVRSMQFFSLKPMEKELLFRNIMRGTLYVVLQEYLASLLSASTPSQSPSVPTSSYATSSGVHSGATPLVSRVPSASHRTTTPDASAAHPSDIFSMSSGSCAAPVASATKTPIADVVPQTPNPHDLFQTFVDQSIESAMPACASTPHQSQKDCKAPPPMGEQNKYRGVPAPRSSSRTAAPLTLPSSFDNHPRIPVSKFRAPSAAPPPSNPESVRNISVETPTSFQRQHASSSNVPMSYEPDE